MDAIASLELPAVFERCGSWWVDRPPVAPSRRSSLNRVMNQLIIALRMVFGAPGEAIRILTGAPASGRGPAVLPRSW